MFYTKNHKQLNIFDHWAYLGPKRRKELEKSWAGFFRREILETLPVEVLRKHYHDTNGRPTKELYSMLGLMILQQMHDLTDEQAVEQFCFNIKWHYALNITKESDDHSYVSVRSLWEMRSILTKENLHELLFEDIAKKLAAIFQVDLKRQRLDSVHVQSNMRHLGRIGLFCKTVKKFLKNLKRHEKRLFQSIDKPLRDRYLDKKEEAIFALVKPSESYKTLNQLAQDIFTLIEMFRAKKAVNSMSSFKLLVRLFQEQCITEEDAGNQRVLAKPNKDVPSDSLQNPSDPDAGYSGHKGKGYSVQVMETYSHDPQEKDLSLITYIAVQSADNSDAHALLPAIEKTEEQGLAPESVLADTLYGSDDNVHKAETDHNVEVVSPLKNNPEGYSLADFTLDDSGAILKCPRGKVPDRVRFKKRFSASFGDQCEGCTQRKICPVTQGKKASYYRYTIKDVRIAKRRSYERTAEFRDRYRFRAGVEATMSEYDRLTGVKKLRVRGKPAVCFAAFLKAAGLNIKRAAMSRKWKKMLEKYLERLFVYVFFRLQCFKERFLAGFQKISAQLGHLDRKIFFSREFAR